MKAVFNGTTIADSDRTIVVEGNHYFPLSDVSSEFLHVTPTHTVIDWKGMPSYYNVKVDGEVAPYAAWYYETPTNLSMPLKNRVAFWQGVEVFE